MHSSPTKDWPLHMDGSLPVILLCSAAKLDTTWPARFEGRGRRASNPTTMYMEMSLPPARRSAASRSCLVSGSSSLSSARRLPAARRLRAPPCRAHALLSLEQAA